MATELQAYQEILDRLKPALDQEGLEVELLGVEDQTLNIRARRVGPGVPVAFMVRAISGTFRRYQPDIQDVCLTEYDPGPEDLRPTKPSPDFEKVLNHRPASPIPRARGIPGVDLSGLDRRQAVRALEAFTRSWSRRSKRLRVLGLEEEQPRRAAEKWASYYEQEFHRIRKDEDQPGAWTIELEEGLEAVTPDDLVEVIPGKVFLVEP